jgi:hypothetical protein
LARRSNEARKNTSLKNRLKSSVTA